MSTVLKVAVFQSCHLFLVELQFPDAATEPRINHADLSLGVAKDDSLCDGECVVQVTQCVKLPLLSLHCHKELLDAL